MQAKVRYTTTQTNTSSFVRLLLAIIATFAFASSTLIAAAHEHDHDHDEPHHSECFVYTLPAKGISSPPPVPELTPDIVFEPIAQRPFEHDVLVHKQRGNTDQARAPPLLH